MSVSSGSFRAILWVALAVLAFGAGCSGSGPTVPAGEEVLRWARFERIFTAETEAPDPSAELVVTFVAPDGSERPVEGFWDGGSLWRVRFQPDAVGDWRYRTRSAPAVAGLDGVEGRFTVRAAESDNRFLRHGPIRVSDDGRYLAHADGTPFFWLGDTAWNGPLRAQSDDWNLYLHDRVEKQFSVIQFVTTQWRAAYTDAEGLTAYTVAGPNAEDLTIHPAFFQRLDRRVDAINEAGLLAAPVLLWALGDPDESPVPGKLPAEQGIKLARYVTARYGAHHVAWFLAGDENFGDEREAHWKTIGRAVFGDGPHAPVTLHPQGMQWKFAPFTGEDWLDFLIYQSGHGDSPNTLAWTHSGPPSKAWQAEPARPIINSEPNYEDHVAYQSKARHTAYTVRRAAYWSLLTVPTAGVSYGAHGIWSWEPEPAVPLNHRGSGEARPWEEAMQLPGSAQMRYVAELFTGLDWWTLRPSSDLLAEQPGADDPARFVAASASGSGDLAVLYLPVGGTVRLSEPADGLEARWYDPRTGTWRSAGGGSTFSAPNEEDWVLVLN